MFYKLCSNGRAILEKREPVILDNELVITLDVNDNNYTAVITMADNTYYRAFENGIAKLEIRYITAGVIKINIIKNDEIKPFWVCDELAAIRKGDVVVVGANVLEYDKLLNELRIENDKMAKRVMQIEKDLAELAHHYEEIYEGYEQL